MKEYDIVIIGAGPSGATLARLLGNEYKVLLVDKRELDNNNNDFKFGKSCGGLIAPDAQKILAQFSLGIPKYVLVDPQLFTVRVIDFDNNIDRYYQRHYINVDREKFDRWLVSIIPSGVDMLFSSRLLGLVDKGEFYELNIKREKKTLNIKADIVIGADGANSKVRKFISKLNFKKYVSIQEWYNVKNSMPYFSSIFDKSITDFYSWTIPKDNYLILGTAIPEDDNIIEKFKILKGKLINYGYDFDKKYKKEGAFIVRPQKLNQIYLGKKNIALVGEAAGLISPSSAEGISYALKSASYLANSILKDKINFFDFYKKDIRKLKLNIILKNLKSPFMYNKTLRYTVMKSKISSMEIKI